MLSYLLDIAYAWVWGVPLLALITGVGVYLTVRLNFIQFSYLGYAFRLMMGMEKVQSGAGDISHFQSLMTALAATIGIGNIAGVATAIVVGGPGALFWMWIAALLGMSTKYAEAYLAIKYRQMDGKGEMAGGPMFFIEKGLNMKWLAILFAFFGVIASFGGGNMLQANSVAHALYTSDFADPLVSGGVMALIVGITLIGGIHAIGHIASYIVPFMAFVYMGGALLVILANWTLVPEALWTIVHSAFSGSAAFGGFAGASIATALQVGISRGLMTSEAGLGTASIAAAAAKTDHPGRQALISMTGSFLATIVMCSITALTLGVTGVFGATSEAGELLTGAALTMKAFTSVLSWGGHVVTFGIVFFGFTTIIGWAYYGEKCMEYLFGLKAVPVYRLFYTLVVWAGAVLNLEIVWRISDIFNGLMAFPNLIGVSLLSGLVIKETKEFLRQIQEEQAIAANAKLL